RGYHILRSMHQELPEAIICVNDNQAIAACEEAVRDGFTVPDDFAVTGFDNFDKAGFYSPRITTMSNVREKLSARAVDILVDAWNGKPMPKKVYNPVDFLKYESCGCRPPLPNIRQNLKMQVLENIDGDRYASELLDLESVMPKCNTIEEVAEAVDEQLELMRGDAFYLMVDPKVFAVSRQISAKPTARENLTSNFCRGCYPLQMQIVYAREGEKRERDFEGQMISDIFPLLSLDKPAEDYLFMPIHFEESSIGYVAFRNVTGILDKQMYFKAVMTIQRRIEELYKAATARQINERLSLLYKTDALTEVLNRLGYNEEGSAYFEQHHRRGQQIYVMFCDLDRLKFINDNYGHKAGDRAITDIANTLRAVLGKDSVIARMGGDEFVAMGTFVSDEDLEDIRQAIDSRLQTLRDDERLPYDLTVSMGTSIVDATATEGLEHFVREADERMYAEKMKHRGAF
ncbi:MAG: diguanylate cyclase, partial [Lachnospiraceae bacterium]|nr:diguanylate cyclase [Lachnospiraceae bacterium]